MDLSKTASLEKKQDKNYTYNEDHRILVLSNCTNCDTEIHGKRRKKCAVCYDSSRKYNPEDYQKRRSKILEVFTPCG